MGIISNILNRLHSDYLRPSRLSKYEAILKRALSLGYQFISLRDHCEKFTGFINNETTGMIVLNRHDIDTDVATARKMFEIEKRLGVIASYYFRLSTLDFELMSEIEEFGSEASYHYEEIASYCKKYHIKSKYIASKNMESIRQIFSENFRAFELKIGKKIITVCSHGDFVNRALSLKNSEILASSDIREQLGIRCEAYDANIVSNFDLYVSDCSQDYGNPSKIYNALGSVKKIYLLTHPRQWYTNVVCNTFDNLKRFYEGLKW